ncbi:MAG: hypothetical protein IT300_07310 [Dehalococcoidia bacterium]|nr:hypothetical protein [Dehalococcoidia bacterium]
MTQDESSEVEIFFEKSPQYRVIHADGAWGGLTAQLGLHLAFYSEFRQPPESITYGLANSQPIEKARTGREAIVRHIEAEVAFNLQTAASLRDWLDTKLREAEAAAKEAGISINWPGGGV